MSDLKSLGGLTKQAGIGLLELMLSLAIIAVLLVMATRYYESALLGERANTEVGILQAMRGAAAQYSAGQPTYDNVTFSNLAKSGLIPKALESSIKVGPWGGNLDVTGAGQQLTVKDSLVPGGACDIIKQRLFNDDVSCPPVGTNGEMTVMFDQIPH